MKKFFYFLVTCIVVLILTTYLIVPDLKAQTKVDLSGLNIRASKGDTVWVLLSHIKPDKCEQFEKVVHEILWPVAYKLDPIDQQVAKQTRVLHPVKMNADSTYTYIFLMDPLIPKANYSAMYYLKKGYGEEKAKEYYKMFEECFASPQIGYTVIQSQY